MSQETSDEINPVLVKISRIIELQKGASLIAILLTSIWPFPLTVKNVCAYSRERTVLTHSYALSILRCTGSMYLADTYKAVCFNLA